MKVQADHPIIDGDGHVVEVDADVRAYLPERYRRIPDNREYPLFPMEPWSFGVGDRHKQDVPTAEARRLILSENPQRLYRLRLPALAAR